MAAPVAPRASFLGASAVAHVALFIAMRQPALTTPGIAAAPQAFSIEEVAPEIVPTVEKSAGLPSAPESTGRWKEPMAHKNVAARHTQAPARPALPSAEAAAAAPLRFTMAIDSTVATGGSGAAAPEDHPATAASAANPWSETDVSSPARLVGEVLPLYPSQARAQGAQGDVVLAIVVDATGAVAQAQVLRNAGLGFDESALSAVRAAHFSPARRGGRPVAVRMRWTVSFRLR